MTYQDVSLVGEVYHKTEDGRCLVQVTQHYTTKEDLVVSHANVVVQTENKDVQLRMQRLEDGNLVEIQGEFVPNEFGSPPIHKNGNPIYIVNAYRVAKLAESADEKRDSDKFQITLLGNAGKDVEMQYTAKGKAFTHISVATNKTLNFGKENEEQITTWFRPTDWWGDLENGMLKNVKKGNRILLKADVAFDPETHGPRPWKTTEGETRSSFDLKPILCRIVNSGGNGHSVAYETATEEIDIPF